MSGADVTFGPAPSRLVAAEVLKLRRRRSLVAVSVLLVVVPVVLGFTVAAVLHATDPARYGPAGGAENLRGTVEMLTRTGAVAAVLIGTTAGAGDVAAGVFRELVVTGRSRLVLFAVRIPGGAAFLFPLAAVAFVIAAAASVALAESLPAPGAGLVLRYAGWLALALALAFALALGVSSLLGSRATSIAVLLGWELAIAPMLLQTGRLDAVLPGAALARLEPAGATGDPVSIPVPTAVLLVVAWIVVPLVAGAWRTETRDA